MTVLFLLIWPFPAARSFANYLNYSEQLRLRCMRALGRFLQASDTPGTDFPRFDFVAMEKERVAQEPVLLKPKNCG